MKKILLINACVKPDSRTLRLAKFLLEKIEGVVQEINLYQTSLAPLDLKGMKKRDEAAKKQNFDDRIFDLAKQFADADTIVIAAPYWDMMFPAILKTYLENVTVCGLTFCYSPQGIPQGMCKAKNLYYVTTAGGPIFHNFGFEYVEALAKSFYSIPNVKCISAQGLDLDGADVEQILRHAKESIRI